MSRLRAVFALCGILTLVAALPAQQQRTPVDALALPFNQGTSALIQSLRKLRTRASLAMVTAHPDDEDGGMLTYESRGVGARTVLMTLSRGEGGQNVMSNDYFDALGEVRTQELLKAGRYYGVEQYWSRVIDYGFSKTKEEALEKWGHDRVLSDVVRVIRMTRPLVVTSVFVGGPTDGHGHHQIAGVMAQEVFNAAGDPNVFPEQIKAGLLPWKPLKVYARMPFAITTDKGMYDYATGKYVPVRFYDYVNKKWIEGPLKSNLEIPEGNYDPILGQSYVQISRAGLGFQKSQTGGIGPVLPGETNSGYHRFGSLVSVPDQEKTFYDGIDVTVMGIATLAGGGDITFLKQALKQISDAIEEANTKFDIQNPERIAPALGKGLKATRALIADVQKSNLSPEAKYNVIHELRTKEGQFNDALTQALGVSFIAAVAPEKDPTGFMFGRGSLQDGFQVAIRGQQFWVKVIASGQSDTPIKIEQIALKGNEGEPWDVQPVSETPTSLVKNKQTSIRFKVTVPQNAKYTKPYFSRPDVEQPYYDIHDEKSVNAPTSPYPLAAEMEMYYDGEPIRVSQMVQSVRSVTGAGSVLDPLIVGPAISVSIFPKAGVIPLSGSKLSMSVALHSNVKGAAKGRLKLALPAGWVSNPAQADFEMAKDGEDRRVSFEVTPANLQPKKYEVTAVAEWNGEKFAEGYTMTGYEGLRGYPLYSSAAYLARGVDVKIAPSLRVAYVMGTGDDVPKSLEDIGVHTQFLSPQDIASADLSKFDSILLGVRAYAARPDLISNNGRLLDYVKNGGVVFVQYNTQQYDRNYGPYPYTLSRDPEKVVDETAKVNILAPDNPLMNWPNKITSADFDGWVEERGHSFMKTWDSHYEALTETHDPDQEPQRGGLLYARYGKGVYVYGAYALYRQVAEGVPGAFRIFANVMSLSHNPAIAKAAWDTK